MILQCTTTPTPAPAANPYVVRWCKLQTIIRSGKSSNGTIMHLYKQLNIFRFFGLSSGASHSLQWPLTFLRQNYVHAGNKHVAPRIEMYYCCTGWITTNSVYTRALFYTVQIIIQTATSILAWLTSLTWIFWGLCLFSINNLPCQKRWCVPGKNMA